MSDQPKIEFPEGSKRPSSEPTVEQLIVALERGAKITLPQVLRVLARVHVGLLLGAVAFIVGTLVAVFWGGYQIYPVVNRPTAPVAAPPPKATKPTHVPLEELIVAGASPLDRWLDACAYRLQAEALKEKDLGKVSDFNLCLVKFERFKSATTNFEFVLTPPPNVALAGYAFLARDLESRTCYEPISLTQDGVSLRLRVPEAHDNDRLIALVRVTTLSGSLPSKQAELRALISGTVR